MPPAPEVVHRPAPRVNSYEDYSQDQAISIGLRGERDRLAIFGDACGSFMGRARFTAMTSGRPEGERGARTVLLGRFSMDARSVGAAPECTPSDPSEQRHREEFRPIEVDADLVTPGR